MNRSFAKVTKERFKEIRRTKTPPATYFVARLAFIQGAKLQCHTKTMKNFLNSTYCKLDVCNIRISKEQMIQ